MYGEAAYAEISYGDSIELVAPIIPEVGFETRQLIFVIEVDTISVAIQSVFAPTTFTDGSTFDDGTLWAS